MLKLKLQYFGHLTRRVDSLEKTLMLGGIGGRRRRGRQRMRWMWVWVNSGRRWWTGRPSVLQFMGCTVGHDWVTELNRTERYNLFTFSIGTECMGWSDARLCTSSWWLAQVIGLIGESNNSTADENLDIIWWKFPILWKWNCSVTSDCLQPHGL